MVSARQRRLFEELGLLAERPPKLNPYAEIGLDSAFARRLLEEDSTGSAIQFVSKALARALEQRYHTDASNNTETRGRFEAVHEAAERIKAASADALRGWLDPLTRPTVDPKVQERQTILMERAAELVRQNVELGAHPLHFSQAQWSQGVLLRRQAGALLLRQRLDDTIQVQPARQPEFDKGFASRDLQHFLAQHGSFGLEQGTRIAAYLDEDGRASVMTPGLSYLMDITTAVSDHRERSGHNTDDFATWDNSPQPLLITTQVPGFDPDASYDTRMNSFPRTRRGQAAAWDMPLQVAGSLRDTDYFARSRTRRPAGAVALEGAGATPSAKYFGIAPAPTIGLIMDDAGYTPLVDSGNALMLYNPTDGLPMATDAIIMGMLGNGPQAGTY